MSMEKDKTNLQTEPVEDEKKSSSSSQPETGGVGHRSAFSESQPTMAGRGDKSIAGGSTGGRDPGGIGRGSSFSTDPPKMEGRPEVQGFAESDKSHEKTRLSDPGGVGHTSRFSESQPEMAGRDDTQSYAAGRVTPGTEGMHEGEGKHRIEEMQEKLSFRGEKVKQETQKRVIPFLSSRKERLVEQLNDTAGALRETGAQMDESNRSADLVRMSAKKIEQLGGYLGSREIDDIVDDLQQYARSKPWMIMGGAFVLGIAAARFIKAGGRQH
ncbi:MAG: hypothetical protein VR64_01770 [Desulfatitalea sp. BRH_c12]|nr:MAG: hypothetical protein VR64_01770 [Desulfatitalea sp. BRH_c12]